MQAAVPRLNVGGAFALSHVKIPVASTNVEGSVSRVEVNAAGLAGNGCQLPAPENAISRVLTRE